MSTTISSRIFETYCLYAIRISLLAVVLNQDEAIFGSKICFHRVILNGRKCECDGMLLRVFCLSSIYVRKDINEE